MMGESLVGLFQLADGLFPSGGFAHSLGLETYVQEGAVADRAGLEAFVAAHLEGTAGPCDAVALATAHAAALAGDAARLAELDALLDAMKPAAEAREASRQMGRQTLRVVAALAPIAESDLHHAIAFAIGAATLAPGAPARDACAAYLYATAAMLAGAGVRLLPIGQLDAQRVLAAVRPLVARLAEEAAAAAARGEAPRSFAPGLEVAQMRHERLDGRLFRS